MYKERTEKENDKWRERKERGKKEIQRQKKGKLTEERDRECVCGCAMEENREGEVIRNRCKASNRKKDKERVGKS